MEIKNYIFILIIMLSVNSIGQNMTDVNKQLDDYYKERGVAVPESNMTISIPQRKTSTPILTNQEINAYPLDDKSKVVKTKQKPESNQLSLYEKSQLNKKSTETILESLRDSRVSSTEFVAKEELKLTNKSLEQSSQKTSNNSYQYVIGIVLLLLVGFLGYKLNGKI